MANTFQNLKQPSQFEINPLLQALNSKQLHQAELIGKSLLKTYINSYVLHNLLGIALDGQGKHTEAITSYRQALAINSTVPDIYFNLGIALNNNGELEEAISSYKTAIRIKPNFFEAYGNLGTILQSKGLLDEAVIYYKQAISIQPDARGFFNLGTALRDQGKLEEAVLCYKKAISIFPNYADAHSNLGETLRDQGKMDEAIVCYQDALTLNPNHPSANYNMAEFLYLANRFEEAIPYFEKSGIDDWQERSMYCLYKSEQFSDFKSKLDEISKSTPHNAPFLATLSTHYAINFNAEDPYNFCKNGFDFVYNRAIPELSEPNSSLLKQLLEDINNTEIAERVQGMLHNGKQSAGNLFKRPESSFRTLGEIVKREFLNYKNTFSESSCELIRSFPTDLEFTSSWYVRMKQGGHLDSHIHEIGWISGAVYLAMPQHKKNAEEGGFEYGTHGDNYPKKHDNFPVKRIIPKVGEIVLFPSSLFHRTIPFSSNEERICIAFDLKPAGNLKRSSAY